MTDRWTDEWILQNMKKKALTRLILNALKPFSVCVTAIFILNIRDFNFLPYLS